MPIRGSEKLHEPASSLVTQSVFVLGTGKWTVTPHWRREEYVWNPGFPWGILLVLPCPVIQASEKLQRPTPRNTRDGPDPSGIEDLVTPPGKEPPPAEQLAAEQEHGF